MGDTQPKRNTFSTAHTTQSSKAGTRVVVVVGVKAANIQSLYFQKLSLFEIPSCVLPQ